MTSVASPLVAPLDSSPLATSPSDSAPVVDKRWTLALVAVAAVALGAGLAVVDGLPVGVVADDSMYVILARSLASGQGYRFLNVPGLPAATHFPPGYPALLALVSFLAPPFPDSVVIFKALNAGFLAVVAVAIATLLRRRLDVGAGWAAMTGLVTAVSVPLLLLSSMVLSELFFLALLLTLLPALERLVDEPRPASRVLALGAFIALCALVRSHGVVLLPAVMLALAVRRRWRDCALIAGATIVCLAPWQLWLMRHSGVLPAPLLGMYDSYTAWWLRGLAELGPSMISATLAKTIPETGVMFAQLFSPVRGELPHGATLAGLAMLAIAGCVASWRRLPVTLGFLAGYLAIVLVWPFPTARFVWAVWPLLLALVMLGGRAAVRRSEWAVPARAVLAGAFVWVAAGYAAYEVRGVRGAWWSSIARANTERIVPTVRWVAAHTAPEDVVASESEGAVYLYANRQALPIVSLTPGQYLHDRSSRESAIEGLEPV
ncbi:MAG: hypothetical protein JWL95_1698, partial [Gemmatimonadetes bacterium]|nr:hypothetical protein [Gemmatimonadota bacterium]